MTHRIERVNNLIRREVSELIRCQLRDPRLDDFVAVTEVNTSVDLKYAKVFVSCISGKQEEQKTLGVLNAASGFLRKELARNLNATTALVERVLGSLKGCGWDVTSPIEESQNIMRVVPGGGR